jgi:3alpha(or 20beta)-hydroxysteroid dehydrogenase
MADQRFEGRVAIVTGGAGDIGRSVAAALLAEGASVALVDANREHLEHVAGELRSVLPGRLLAVAGDVRREEEVEGYVRQTLEELGRVNLFFNNAGIEGPRGSFGELDPADFDRVIAVNVRGVFLGLHFVLPVLERQGAGGSVVNTASMAGLKGAARFSPYIASKHAVIGLTRSAALEAAAYGVRVNAIAPGYIDTRMLRALDAAASPDDPEAARERRNQQVPMRRTGSADEVARLVLWLFGDDSSYVTGSVQVIDGGLMAG